MNDKLHWLDVEDLAEVLLEKYPDRDPLTLRFTELTDMVEQLDEFEANSDHPVNERILETIQANWCELHQEEQK